MMAQDMTMTPEYTTYIALPDSDRLLIIRALHDLCRHSVFGLDALALLRRLEVSRVALVIDAQARP